MINQEIKLALKEMYNTIMIQKIDFIHEYFKMNIEKLEKEQSYLKHEIIVLMENNIHCLDYLHFLKNKLLSINYILSFNTQYLDNYSESDMIFLYEKADYAIRSYKNMIVKIVEKERHEWLDDQILKDLVEVFVFCHYGNTILKNTKKNDSLAYFVFYPKNPLNLIKTSSFNLSI